MIEIHKPIYAPDLDTSWSRNPGALYGMGGYVPLQRGWYGSIGKTALFATTPSERNVLHAAMFRQTTGGVRMLVFRPNDIDEYDSAGVKTNRGTGYSTATDWNAVAWGNRIIAVSVTNLTQTSTGTGFTDLTGSPPRAAHVAANTNFVMLANLNVGGLLTPDEVWWCAIGNPLSWATGVVGSFAARVQLLDAPGAITALVAFRDTFVAFKDNSTFVGQFTGQAPGFFEWRIISNRIGTRASHSICELDNKLYFVHNKTGVWEYDGASMRNVSLPVFQTILMEAGLIESYEGNGSVTIPRVSIQGVELSFARCVADDIEGVLQVMIYQQVVSGGTYLAYVYCYNVRSGLWSRVGFVTQSEIPIAGAPQPPLFVHATTADLHMFQSNDVRSAIIANDFSSGMFGTTYPAAASTAFVTPRFTAGSFGSINKSENTLRAYAETQPGSTVSPFASCALQGYANVSRTTTSGGVVTAAANTGLDCFDGQIGARFTTVTFTGADAKKILLSGVGVGDINR